MIISVPPETCSVTIRRSGDATVIVLDADHALSKTTDEVTRPSDVVIMAKPSSPRRATFLPFRALLSSRQTSALAGLIVVVLLGSVWWHHGKAEVAPAAPVADKTQPRPLPSSLQGEERQIQPAVPATPPNAAFGLE